MNSKIKLFSILGLALCIQSAGLKDDTITKEDGTYIINTTELGKNIEG
jgi:electron transport complex protein RnfG